MSVVDAVPEYRDGIKGARIVTKQGLRVDESAGLPVSANGELYRGDKSCAHQMGGVSYGKIAISYSPMPNELPPRSTLWNNRSLRIPAVRKWTGKRTHAMPDAAPSVKRSR